MMTQNQSGETDTNNAPPYLITCGILGLIGLVLLCLRIYSKLRPVPRLGPAVILLSLGLYLLSLSGYASGITAAVHGWGHRTPFVADSDRTIVLQLTTAIIAQHTFSVCFIRMSVALSLLRLSMNKSWKTTLWGLIIIQLLTSAGWIVICFAWCRPLHGSWEYVEGFECWDPKYEVAYGWTVNAIYVFMDLAFALMPIKLVWKLHRPLREKILIGCLMGIGLIATVAACVKGIAFKNFGHGDPISNRAINSLYAKIEEQLGIIAACIPCLKVPAERFLRQAGLISERKISYTKPSFVLSGSFQYSSSPEDGGSRGDMYGDGIESIPLSPIEETHFPRTSSSGNHSEGGSEGLSLSNGSTYYGGYGLGGSAGPTLPERAVVSTDWARSQHTRSATTDVPVFTRAAVNPTAPLPPLDEPAPGRIGGKGRRRERSEPVRVNWQAF